MKMARVLEAALAVLAMSGAGLLAHRILQHETTAGPTVYEVRPETVSPAATPPMTTPSTGTPRRTAPSSTTTIPHDTIPHDTTPDDTTPDDTTPSSERPSTGLESWLNDLVDHLKRRVR